MAQRFWERFIPSKQKAVVPAREVPGPTRRIVLPPEQRLPAVRREKLEVRLRPRPYWQEMGWRRRGRMLEVFDGHYQAGSQRFPGHITQLYATKWEFEVEVARPWPGMDGHVKWQCFRPTGAGHWYRIHWHIEPRSVDSGIQDIEKTLAEMLARRR